MIHDNNIIILIFSLLKIKKERKFFMKIGTTGTIRKEL